MMQTVPNHIAGHPKDPAGVPTIEVTSPLDGSVLGHITVACGNSFILKPSEQVPFTPLRLADLLKEGGYYVGPTILLHKDRKR